MTGKRPQTKIGKECLLDLMRESESIPSHLVDVSRPKQAVDSHLCKILYNFGQQCTLDRAKKRPEMEDVYQNLKKSLKVENTSPTPYELQQRFDSMDKKPERTPYQGFVVSDAANLIDLSIEKNASAQEDNIPMVVHQSDRFAQQGIPATVLGFNQSAQLQTRDPSNDMNITSGLYMPAVINESARSPVQSSFVESSFLPSVLSDAISITPTPSSSMLPAVLDTHMSSNMSSCSTFTGSEEQDSDEQDKLGRIEQDIDQSADLLANLGF